ncbi:retropepsin-like aspartic protease [Amphritea sp. HPY]|uniref:retropepsin-like aspartic protease n=1 Tax=Amphritea sp. HPY TaxID=3421652 RepID=UPI003D7D677A
MNVIDPRAVLAVLLVFLFNPGTLQAEVISYVDDTGRKVFVDHVRKIPPRFRDQSESFKEEGELLPSEDKQTLDTQRKQAQQALTRQRALRKLEQQLASMQSDVIVRGNQVIVPVKLYWRGRSANLKLLLDTGASMTVVHSDAVVSLKSAARSSSYAQVAGGGVISTEQVVFDRLEFGPYKLASKTVSVIDTERASGFDGLLGMDIISQQRYEIDFARQKITWNPDGYRKLSVALEEARADEDEMQSSAQMQPLQ